ncbi:F0F1 ATP synthase subunit B [Elusimicrobiota bacterium]
MLDINPGLLLAQAVTFLLGLTILWFVAWKPLVARMRSRRQDLEKSLKDIDDKTQAVEALKKNYEAELSKLEAKAQEVLGRAQQQGKDAEVQAKEEAKKLVESAREQIKQEKTGALNELRKEISTLIVFGIEKVLKTKMDVKADDKIISDAIKDAEKISRS